MGITQGGALDLHAYCWGNHLLGNLMTCSQLEITIGQAEFLALDDIYLAITGADMGACIDNTPIQPWSSFPLYKGQTLRFNVPRKGIKAYLAHPRRIFITPHLQQCLHSHAG